MATGNKPDQNKPDVLSEVRVTDRKDTSLKDMDKTTKNYAVKNWHRMPMPSRLALLFVIFVILISSVTWYAYSNLQNESTVSVPGHETALEEIKISQREHEDSLRLKSTYGLVTRISGTNITIRTQHEGVITFGINENTGVFKNAGYEKTTLSDIKVSDEVSIGYDSETQIATNIWIHGEENYDDYVWIME